MSIDKTVTQLEFPFLTKMRMTLYIDRQRTEMKDLWNLCYRYDGDHGKEMRFGDFIADIWVKGGYAKRFHERNHRHFFYDAPEYTQLYTGIQHQ